uniref:Uncharacterized protein n=1 Tax=Strigamia maritima TaxID=126957 RepID=T1J3W7_STRMM
MDKKIKNTFLLMIPVNTHIGPQYFQYIVTSLSFKKHSSKNSIIRFDLSFSHICSTHKSQCLKSPSLDHHQKI